MQYTTTLTQKGQITLPVQIRRLLGLQTRDKVIVQVIDNQVVVKSPKDILDMAGSVKPIKGINDLTLRQKMEHSYQRT